jgi:hypothetical protein
MFMFQTTGGCENRSRRTSGRKQQQRHEKKGVLRWGEVVF